MSDPNQPADGGKRPLDLKSRLQTSALRPASPAAPAPSSAGTLPPPPSSAATLPPPPVRVAKVEAPTAETIEAARRRAEEHAREAGPAFEEFSIGGAPEKTPVPTVSQAGPRVEYVDVPVHELTPEMKARHRNLIVGVSLGAALVAFLLGLAFSSAGAMSKLKENMVFEAQEKLASLKSQQPNFDRMKALAGELKAFNDKAAALNAANEKAAAAGGPITELASLEDDVAALHAKVSAFVESKPAVDPGSIIGSAVYNGPLMSSVLGFAQRTQIAAAHATALLEEVQTLVAMWRPVPPEQQTVLVYVEPIERDHPKLGKVAMGKGRLIKDFGEVAKVDGKGPDGRPVVEFQQKVVLDGEQEPKQVKTTQVAQTELASFFNGQLTVTKNVSIARIVELSARLQKSLEGCSPDATLAEIRKFLGEAGASEDLEGAAPPESGEEAPAAEPAPAAAPAE